MAKTATLYARIEPDVKEEAEMILSTLGISVSSAINMFYKQIILQRGIPFELKVPSEYPLFLDQLSPKQLEEELEKGYQDYLNGDVEDTGAVFSDLKKEYGL